MVCEGDHDPGSRCSPPRALFTRVGCRDGWRFSRVLSPGTEQFHFGSASGPSRGQLEAIAHLGSEGDEGAARPPLRSWRSAVLPLFFSVQRGHGATCEEEQLFASRFICSFVAGSKDSSRVLRPLALPSSSSPPSTSSRPCSFPEKPARIPRRGSDGRATHGTLAPLLLSPDRHRVSFGN